MGDKRVRPSFETPRSRAALRMTVYIGLFRVATSL
jgi:hypothetical protein